MRQHAPGGAGADDDDVRPAQAGARLVLPRTISSTRSSSTAVLAREAAESDIPAARATSASLALALRFMRPNFR